MSFRKSMLLCVLVAVVLSALLSRTYATAGFILAVAALGIYTALSARKTWAALSSFKTLKSRDQVQVVVNVLVALVLVAALINGTVGYFPALALLVTEFMTENGDE